MVYYAVVMRNETGQRLSRLRVRSFTQLKDLFEQVFDRLERLGYSVFDDFVRHRDFAVATETWQWG